MEKNQIRLSYLDIMINKNGTKIYIDIQNKPIDSKRYVPFTSNHPRLCNKYTVLSCKKNMYHC